MDEHRVVGLEEGEPVWDEVRVVRLCKERRPEGFGQLIEGYQTMVYRICFRIVRNEPDALDCTQETFLRVIEAIETFREGWPLVPWLRRIAVNVCLHFLRCRQRLVYLDDQPEEWQRWEERLASNDDVAGDVEFRALREEIQRAIAELPAIYRTVLMLRHSEHLSYQEIADLLAIPLGTVKTHIFRGRNFLKERLQKAGAFGGDQE